MEMIPKVINYCWFGRNPLPPLAMKCIESWKRFLPDYEIKEWNEDNFDVNIILYKTLTIEIELSSGKKYYLTLDENDKTRKLYLDLLKHINEDKNINK